MLVVTRTVTALNRLLDVVSLIRTDSRIQIVFTADPAGRAVFRHGVGEMLADMGAMVVDWDDAVTVDFDLILTASENDGLHRLRGPILLVSHGFGHQKYYPNSRIVAGMNPARLLRDDRVVPTVIGVSHPEQRVDLAVTCPPAADRAAVIGDPALDRMLASGHRVRSYRHAFCANGRTVLLLASTWGPHSLFGRFPDLPEAMAAALPVDEYRILIVLHPGVWAAHSQWQVRGWLTRAHEAGVRTVDPRHWQAALVASHGVVSDQASLALYATALGKPLLLIGGEAEHTVAGSPLAELAATTPRLDRRTDLAVQVDKLIATPPSRDRQRIIVRGVSEIGRSARAVRRVLYELLDLPDADPGSDYPPALRPATRPVSWTTLVASATERNGVMSVRRVPALRHGFPAESTDFRHLIADLETASTGEVAAATIITCTAGETDRTFAETTRHLLAEWPNARLIATRHSMGRCVIGHAGGLLTAQIDDPPSGFDPILLASVVYVRLARSSPLEGTDRLVLGDRIVTIRVAPN